MNLPSGSAAQPGPASSSTRTQQLQLVHHLQQHVAGVFTGEASTAFPRGTSHKERGSRWETGAESWISSGCQIWDRCLPHQEGFRRGSLVEWLIEQPGSGAGTLALLVARQACSPTGTLVVLDEARRFYPPAAAACGIDLQRLIVIRPRHARDALWAWDQALRCPAVQAVWGWIETINDRWFRRFQLAAERSGCLGLLLRPGTSRGKPSWSELQLAISAGGSLSAEICAEVVESRCVRVEVVRCRGAAWPEGLAVPGGPTAGVSSVTGAEQGGDARSVMYLRLEERQGQLQVIAAPEHETTPLPLFPPLAPPAFSRDTSRA